MWTKLQEYSDLNQKDSYLAWGMLQIFRGVAFLHEANLIHGSLHAGSVFVTPAGKFNSRIYKDTLLVRVFRQPKKYLLPI